MCGNGLSLECLSNAKTRSNIVANPMTCDRNMRKQWGGHGPPPRIRTLCMYKHTDQEN